MHAAALSILNSSVHASVNRVSRVTRLEGLLILVSELVVLGAGRHSESKFSEGDVAAMAHRVGYHWALVC